MRHSQFGNYVFNGIKKYVQQTNCLLTFTDETFAHSRIHISVEKAQVNIIFYIFVVKLFVINSVLTQPQL